MNEKPLRPVTLVDLAQHGEPDSRAEVRAVRVSEIRAEPHHSPRLTLAKGRIRAFARIMQERGFEAFPPVVLAQRPDEESYDVVDGRHRIESARQAGLDAVLAIVCEGTSERELFAASVRLSARNGLPLTNPEKRRAVCRLLVEFTECSTRALAEMAGTSHNLVAVCRRSIELGQDRAAKKRAPVSAERHAERLLYAADALQREAALSAENPVEILEGAAQRRSGEAALARTWELLAAWVDATRARRPEPEPHAD